MFPPMVSASPPPSDDELSGDEGEELGVADSSYDITGLSQKLPVCQPQHHKPAARPEQDPPPDALTPSPVPPPVCQPQDHKPAARPDQDPPPDPVTPSPVPPPVGHLSCDDWGEFSGGPVVSNSAGPVLSSDRSSAAPLEFAAPQQDVTGADKELPATIDAPKSEVDPTAAAVASPAQAPSVFSDSDSDSDSGQADRLRPHAAEQKPDTGVLTTDSESAKLGDAVTSAEGGVSAVMGETGRRENDTLTNHQTGTDDSSEVAAGADSESDDFGGFGEATGNDQFGAWSEPVIDSVVTAATQPVTGGSPPPDHGDDGQQGEDAPQLSTLIEPHATQSEPPASHAVPPSSHAVPPDDFGDFEASDGLDDRADGVGGIGAPEGTADRVPSPDDFGTFATPGELPSSSVPVDDVNDITPVTGDEGEAIPSGDPVNTASSTNNSPKRVGSPDDFGSFAKSSDELADCAASPDDFGDFAAPTDDFGDFSAPTDDFGDFAAPTDDFGDFSAPGESSGDAWPPDGAGGGSGSAGFADFGAVFAAPADDGSAGALLEPAGQLADPADFSDDDFGDFEDFQAPASKEPTAVTDEAAVSALLARLFPLTQEEREPASVPLDASGVWYQLREPDATAALQYRWSGCRAYTALLHALRVDVSNIINFGGWGGRPGRFASALDSEPIQPMKGSLVPEPAPAEPPPQQPQQPQQPAVGEVPPAAFDWNSSGLKNPLESTGPGACSLLDLDVFDTDTRPVAASNSFLSCLERELMAAEEPPPPASTSQSGSGTVYSRLLAQTAGPPLSDAANSVLTRIPDIDFMQAKVLMFPVRGE